MVGLFGTLIGAGGGFILMPILLLLHPKANPEQLTAISLAVVFFNALAGSESLSVTRLIAGGLRSGGIIPCAKTTGTLARMILPYASEYPVFRPAGANVIEQVRIVSTVAGVLAAIIFGLYIFSKSDWGFRILQASSRREEMGPPESMV